MTKPQYATAEERRVARSEKAKKQMRGQWERQRQETGQERPGYFGCHRRVRTERGRARDHVCACGAAARHWAHIHGTDPADTQNYLPMCISCHRVYDEVRAQQAETLGAEGRTAAAKLAWSRRSPEQRHEIGRKIWETRRRNAQERASDDSRDPGLAGGAHG